jgi:hypothetical protein
MREAQTWGRMPGEPASASSSAASIDAPQHLGARGSVRAGQVTRGSAPSYIPKQRKRPIGRPRIMQSIANKSRKINYLPASIARSPRLETPASGSM